MAGEHVLPRPLPGTNRDAIVLVGVEPNYRWRTFTDLVADLAHDLGVELVVTLGALLADVPHTRPAPVTGAATDPKLVDELGLQLSRYEGPTGIVGVLLDACRRAGIPSVSLWAAVPHYVSLAPSPRAARALCERLATSSGSNRRERAVRGGGVVRRAGVAGGRERRGDGRLRRGARAARGLARLARGIRRAPSGEALAAEIARFLREREGTAASSPARAAARLSAEAAALGRVFGRLAELRRPSSALGGGRSATPPSPAPSCCAPSWETASALAAAAPCGPFRFRRRRRDLRAVSFGAGRLSASAFAISSIVPISSRAWSSDALARGV